jgi:regulator of sigma E protease
MGIVTFGILVTIHEFGHFWVARRCGVKVVCFSIGFGKSLVSWRDKLGTEYTIAAIPLGGYVRMVDEREGDVAEVDLPHAFNRQSVWARIAIVAAGPLANFILAIAAYWFVFGVGVTGVAPMVKAVEPMSLAAEAGLEVGQEIVAIDGQPTPTWQAVMQQLLFRIGDTGEIEFSVQYPGSDLVYDSKLPIERWLSSNDEPDLPGNIGVQLGGPDFPVLIDQVVADSAALEAGLLSGDQVVAVDGVFVDSWVAWVELVRASADKKLDLTVERNGAEKILLIVPKPIALADGTIVGQVGVSPKIPDDYLRRYQYSVFGALVKASEKTWDMSVFTLSAMGKLITGRISSKNLSGPITIAKVASSSVQSGFAQYIGVLALLSISLGVLNLLPIPVLDGGHLLYYSIEAVTGKPVPEKVQLVGTQLGLAVVLGVMVLAFYNDIMRL